MARRAFSTGFTSNALIIVESLRADERKTGKHLHDDLSALFLVEKFGLEYVEISTANGFKKLIARLTKAAREGLRPVLHLEVHGRSDRAGLVFLPSGDFMAWAEFTDLARELNAATGNNLLIAMAVCHGFRAVLSTSITKLTPFCQLAGPDAPVTDLQVLKAFGPFYRTLLADQDLAEACKGLPPEYHLYSCERLFVSSIGRYFRESTMGKGRTERLERLVTLAKDRAPKLSLREIRQILKKVIKPRREVFDRYRQTFLIGENAESVGRFTVTYEDVRVALGLDPNENH